MLQTYSTDDAEELEIAMMLSQPVVGAAVVGAGVYGAAVVGAGVEGTAVVGAGVAVSGLAVVGAGLHRNMPERVQAVCIGACK